MGKPLGTRNENTEAGCFSLILASISTNSKLNGKK